MKTKNAQSKQAQSAYGAGKAAVSRKTASIASKFGFGKQRQVKVTQKPDFAVLQGVAEGTGVEDVEQEIERLGLNEDQPEEASTTSQQPDASPKLNSRESDDTETADWCVPASRKQEKSVLAFYQTRITAPPTKHPRQTWQTNNNWRAGSRAPTKMGDSTLRIPRCQAAQIEGERTGQNILKADLKKGTVIFRFDERKCDDPDATGENVFTDRDGVKWSRKPRYWLIVYSTAKFMWIIPIYTYGNRGLEKVPARHRKYYLAVRPPNTDPATFENLSGNKAVSIDWVNTNAPDIKGQAQAMGNFRDTMNANYTEVTRHDLDAAIRIVATIDEADVDYLCAKTRDFVQK